MTVRWGNSEFPDIQPNFAELSKQMKINCELMCEQMTLHVDVELARFRKELKKIKEKEVSNGTQL